ncbi:MAG: zinc ribbon domain-containing protein [Bacillota bacterium]
MKTTKLLYQLQNLDKQKQALKDEIEEEKFNIKINNIKDGIKKINTSIEEKEVALAELNEQLKELEFSMSRLNRDEENYQEKLYSGENSNPKELKQIQEKLNKTEVQKREVEEETLDLMMDIEKKEEEIEKLLEKKKEEEEKLQNLQADYKSKTEEIKDELDKIPATKEEIKEKLSADMIEKYNKLYEVNNGQAVAKLKDNYCLGCRMTLPLNVITKLKNSEQIITCDNCGRILYFED